MNSLKEQELLSQAESKAIQFFKDTYQSDIEMTESNSFASYFSPIPILSHPLHFRLLYNTLGKNHSCVFVRKGVTLLNTIHIHNGVQMRGLVI